MPLGSETQRTPHPGEYRTTDEVRLLFERYRAEARSFAPRPRDRRSAVERARAARRAAPPVGAGR